MRIKLTLLRGTDPLDLAVTVDADTTVGDVARCLRDVAAPPDQQEHDEVTVRVHGRAGRPATEVVPATLPASESLRSGSVVSLAPHTGSDDPPRAPRPAARLRVVAGPGAGTTVGLPHGVSVVGRGEGCAVRLTDPAVSIVHARITVTDVVEVADLGSANGVLVDGGLVERTRLLPEDVVTLGDTAVQVELLRGHAGRDAARVAFNRSPLVVPTFPGEQVEVPRPPDPPKPVRLPLVMLAVPLVVAPVLLLTGRSALSLVFLAVMPLMMLGTYLDQRITSRRTFRAAVGQFTSTMSAVRTDLEERRARERRTRSAEHPSVDELTAAAVGLTPWLWARQPQDEAFAELRLGTGAMPSRTRLTLPARGTSPPEYWDQVVRLRDDFAEVADVPVTVRLRDHGALGLAGGTRHLRDAVARAQIAQLVILHSPAELVLTVLSPAADASRWEWVAWLPHVEEGRSPVRGPHLAAGPAGALDLLGRLEDVLDARSAAGRDRTQLPLVVVLVEDEAPVPRARLVRLAGNGPAVGIHVIWCAASVEHLPLACRAFVDLDAGKVGFLPDNAVVEDVAWDQLGHAEAVAVARHLAAVSDAGRVPESGAADLPDRVSYLSVTGTDGVTGAQGVLERWRASGSLGRPDARPRPSSLRAVVGAVRNGPLTLDLRNQGPHALVGGTTGSGKSEFLQSWVLGMATAHSPDRVSFLLVDYKGGAAFGACVDLPHAVGLVTDLTPHLVRRALTSLRAELRHREDLLNRRDAKDLASLERRGDPAAPPSLVIVVDEFAALATDVPEFVDGIVDVAQRGRSLGLHLILATQRPAGVIRDNLRANTNLRIALRMADEADSTDVLGLPLAARFDPAVPGRGAVRTGSGQVTQFQTGFVGGHTAGAAPRPRVRVEALGAGPPRADIAQEPDPEPPPDGPTDISRIVAAVRSAAILAGVPRPRRPWLPPLADVVDLAVLGERTDGALPLGVVDDPAHQQQVTACYEPDVDGNIAFFGTARSGKSTALRTLAAVAATTTHEDPVHVYALDFASGGLAALEALPHVGSVIDGEDTERVQRLLRSLREKVDERARRYSAARAATITEYRAISGHRSEARVLVLLDGLGAFRAGWETATGRAAYYQLFVQLLLDSRAAGVHVALTAERPGALPPPVAAAVARRVVLRQADENAYPALGVPKDVLRASSPPGRAVTDGGLELQVAVPGGSASLTEQVRAIEARASDLRTAGVRLAPAVRRLPEVVSPQDVPDDVGGLPVLGIADDTLAPVGLRPGGTFLLAGPAQSGRTNALCWVVTAAVRARPSTRAVYFGPRGPSAPEAPWDRVALGPAETADLATELGEALGAAAAGHPPTVLAVESITDFVGTPAEAPLTNLVRIARRHGQLVVADAETSAWSSPWPLLTDIRGGRRGLVLQPDAEEGELLFRVRFPRVRRRDFPTGRGIMVEHGRERTVQLPLCHAGGGPV